MGSEATSQSNDRKKGSRLPSVRGWLVLIILFALSAGYLYISSLQKHEFFLNSFYFRTLQEVSSAFNNKLEQLVNLHKYCESPSTISAIFPSYESEDGDGGEKKNGKKEEGAGQEGACKPGTGHTKLSFILEANRLHIERPEDQPSSSVDIVDILSEPREGFALYLIVDEQNNVLSSTAAISGLSMIDARAVSRAVQLQDSEDWARLARQVPSEPADGDAQLPGHSSHVDIGLNTGKSRVFIQPFLLHHAIRVERKTPGAENADGNAESDSAGGPLYLLGVQPKQATNVYENGRWNMSLLLLSLIVLMAVWLGTRLVMLSRHQPIGTFFYGATIFASYLTFLLLVALLLAHAQREAAVAEREALARAVLDQLDSAVSSDLRTIIEALEPYHGIYGRLLKAEADGSIKEPRRPAPGDESTTTCGGRAAHRTWCLLYRLFGYDTLELRPAENVLSFLAGDGGTRVGTPSIVTNGDVDYAPRFTEVNAFPHQARVALASDGETSSEWFDLAEVDVLPGAGRLLSIFLMNNDAWQILPGFFFYETNKPPISYHLSHRSYFRRVRDQRGWEFNLSRECPPAGRSNDGTSEAPKSGFGCTADAGPLTVSNFYMQRLLNINTGTRGTTLAMPLRPQGSNDMPSDDQPRSILGADIEIPSLSFMPWDQPVPMQDVVLMVVDRQSGQVLYHMDADREMVENLYEAGRGTSEIGRFIKSGRPVPRAISGYYNGAPGRFLADDLPVNAWAAVVFIPDSSTTNLMTDAFLANIGGMLALLLVIAVLLKTWQRFSYLDHTARSENGQPATAPNEPLEFALVLIASTYAAFRLGTVFEEYGNLQGATCKCVLLAILVVLLWVNQQFGRVRRQAAPEKQFLNRNLSPLLLPLLLAGMGVWAYLSYIGDAPRAVLNRYYDDLFEARLNQERDESHHVALTRFSNTIRQHGADPLTLLPLSKDWRETLSSQCFELPDGTIRVRQRYAKPDDIGTYSQYLASTNAYDWVLQHLLGKTTTPGSTGCAPRPDHVARADASGVVSHGESSGESVTHASSRTGLHTPWRSDVPSLARFGAAVAGTFLLLCVLWYRVHRSVVTARLTGGEGLLEHLHYIVSRNQPEPAYAPRKHLVLDVQSRPDAGGSLAVLLHRYVQSDTAGDDSSRYEDMDTNVHAGMTLLLQECSWLRDREGVADSLRGLHIAFERTEQERSVEYAGDVERGSLEVHLSNLDACLASAASRSVLLRLVQSLKDLGDSGKLAALRVSLNFHSYESLLLKAHSTQSDRDMPTAEEFADWAGVFVDFSVELPQELVAEIDLDFLAHECGGSNLLSGLIREVDDGSQRPSTVRRRRGRWLCLKDDSKTAAEWATINIVLLKAGALFRHKWESCSGAEKLALYQLARRRRINMANGQLLEQLALQGLIRIDGQRVRIVNNSMAYFARHAEDTKALRELVEIGESGVWQQYRLPITLVILLVLAGIALTSGSSLYLVAASLLGLLGTIGSLTSSAHLIRENLR